MSRLRSWIAAGFLLSSTNTFAMSSPPAPELAEPYQGSVASLAQRCVGIQSPGTGLWLRYEENPGWADGLPSYSFSGESATSASLFYMKPSRHQHFLLRDASSRYLGASVTTIVRAAESANDRTEWTLESTGEGYALYNAQTGLQMAHRIRNGELYFTSALDLYGSISLLTAIPSTVLYIR
jgi:hypothetical protein|tara:strand:- start:1153 stop:1695 length:543 start_codon:yes stop_codon:yes gene_type:complete